MKIKYEEHISIAVIFLFFRYTKSLHNGRCIQIQLHFAGPHAALLEQDFGRLLRTGRQDSPSISIPGYVPDPNRNTKLSYKECDSEVVNKTPDLERRRKLTISSSGSTLAHFGKAILVVALMTKIFFK